MLTIEALKEYGANTEEGLQRCMNNTDFYLRLVGMALQDANFAKLQDAVTKKDMNAAFEAAHSLKGILGNLSLTPLYNPVSEMTELLRSRTEMDYSAYLALIDTQYNNLQELARG